MKPEEFEGLPEEFEGLPAEFDREAISRSLTRYCEMVEQPDKVGFVITSDVTGAVREHHNDPEYARAYEHARPMAYALAKTLFQPDDSVKLILDINLFHEDQPYGDPERHLEHEAYHVVMHEHGETLFDFRRRAGQRGFGLPNDFVAMAGVACEEFRIETLLPSEDLAARLSGLERLARALYRGVQKTCQDYQRHHDVEVLAQAVLDYFHGLTTWTAYVAAELAASNRDAEELELSEPVEQFVLGHPWRDVVRALHELPNAATRAQLSKLEGHAIEVARSLQAWLRFIGFDYDCVDQGAEFLIRRPIQWHLANPAFAEQADDEAT